jgi:hypothetical protein
MDVLVLIDEDACSNGDCRHFAKIPKSGNATESTAARRQPGFPCTRHPLPSCPRVSAATARSTVSRRVPGQIHAEMVDQIMVSRSG